MTSCIWCTKLPPFLYKMVELKTRRPALIEEGIKENLRYLNQVEVGGR